MKLYLPPYYVISPFPSNLTLAAIRRKINGLGPWSHHHPQSPKSHTHLSDMKGKWEIETSMTLLDTAMHVTTLPVPWRECILNSTDEVWYLSESSGNEVVLWIPRCGEYPRYGNSSHIQSYKNNLCIICFHLPRPWVSPGIFMFRNCCTTVSLSWLIHKVYILLKNKKPLSCALV